MAPRTLFDKVWEDHIVTPASGDLPAVIYIDLHLIHEVTSPQAFSALRERGLKVRRPDRTIGTCDHSIPTTPCAADGHYVFGDAQAASQVRVLEENCDEFGVPLFRMGDPRQGIVHVIGPELGLTQPGKTIVCGDSHTSTHGAFGALAFGIGTTEVGYVLATQTLPQRRPRTLAIRIDGHLGAGVGAKDLALAVIAQIGVGGGTGHVIEYLGPSIRAMSMDERMTVCNMSIEAGARAGMVAPDDTTFDYLHGRDYAPQGSQWEAALRRWHALPSDDGAAYDREVCLDAAQLAPMVTWGTNPGMGIPVTGILPTGGSPEIIEALSYMGLEGGKPIAGHPIDVVFVGSCTNSRIGDLRAAAAVLRDRKVAAGVRMLVVPGSQAIKAQAEAEGLQRVFQQAGAEWREPGCSMCIAMNGDLVAPGQAVVSTSNRNFKGRQGLGSRTFLASPLTAAACGVTGRITDPRPLLR